MKKPFYKSVLAAHKATASDLNDIKLMVNVINRLTGSKLVIDRANGGLQLVDSTTNRTFTGHIKQKDFLRFVGGFAAGVAFVKKQDLPVQATTEKVTAASEDDTNHDFTATVLALAVSDGVDDSFTGADEVYYACVDFTDEVKQALKAQGFEQASKYAGVIIVFQDGEFSDDIDSAAFTFFASVTEYEGEWTKAEEAAGGRVEEDTEDTDSDTEDADTEDGDEDTERSELDDAADTAVIGLIDSDESLTPSDSAESDDMSQQYSLYKMEGAFLDKLKKLPATSDYCDGMVGVIYWYGKENETDTDFSESVTWYSDEDLMSSDWNDITGQGEE